MTEKINNAQHWLSANASRLSGSEIVVKTSTTFIFTKAKLNSAKYQGKNGSPDKRFDLGCDGLCLFIYPSGTKIFYAVAKKRKRKRKRTRKKNKKERRKNNIVFILLSCLKRVFLCGNQFRFGSGVVGVDGGRIGKMIEG